MGLKSWLAERFAPIPEQLTVASFLEHGFKAADKRGLGPLGLAFGDYAGAGSRMSTMREYLGAIKIPTVKSAVNVIAQSYATAPLQFLDGAGRSVDLRTTEPELHALLQKPNRQMDGHTLREYQAIDLDLCGNSFLVMDEFSVTGQPTSLHRLPPDRARIVRDANADIWYGWITSPSGGAQSRIKWFPEEQVIHTKYAHPMDELWGLGIIEAGEVTFSADKLIGEFKRAYFNRGAILEGILTLDDALSEEEYKAAMNRWRALREGNQGSLKTAILYNGMDYKPIQEPMGNVPIIELSRMSRNDVLQLFGVPPQKLGDFEGTNYRNAVEADHFFNAETMQPKLRRFQPGWTKLAMLYREDLRAEFIGREVLDHKERAETAWRLAQTGAAMRNEIRVAAGLAPLDQDDPAGRVFICISPGFQVMPADVEEPADLLPLGADNPAAADAGAGEFAPKDSRSAAPPEAPAGSVRPAVGTPARPARSVPNVGAKSAVRLPAYYPEGLLTQEARRALGRQHTNRMSRLRLVRPEDDARDEGA